MENKNTPEILTPEQMESGKWYVVDTFLIKFKKISGDRIYRYNSYELKTKCDHSSNPNGYIPIDGNKKIRHATKEEVLKYFPDEVFEPIELRLEEPTDWKSMYNELKAKYDQLEPKGEKVYFYFNEKTGHIGFNENLEVALNLSPQDNEIYEAVCIGKKKSVLVNETT